MEEEFFLSASTNGVLPHAPASVKPSQHFEEGKGRVDSKRERQREMSSISVGSPSNGHCSRCMIRSQEPGASPGLPWSTGPKHVGHPPLPSWATAESWTGRGATGTDSGPNQEQNLGCQRRRRRISQNYLSCTAFSDNEELDILLLGIFLMSSVLYLMFCLGILNKYAIKKYEKS